MKKSDIGTIPVNCTVQSEGADVILIALQSLLRKLREKGWPPGERKNELTTQE